jgi:hypothetical protein
VLERVSIHFGGRGKEEPRSGALRDPEHIDRSRNVGLDGFDRIVLIVHGRRRTREVVELIALKKDRLSDIVPNELKVRIRGHVAHISLGAGE